MQMPQCDNKHLTWSMTELCCLFNQRRSSLQLPTLPSPSSFCTVSSSFPSFLLPSLFPLRIYLFFPFATFLSSPPLLFLFTLRPVSPSPSLSLAAPPLLSLSCFHSHTLSLFPSIGFSCAKFVRSHWQRPLGDKEMTEGGLYLPLWPLPCRLLNHVANRQHCLPARPRSDNGEPHSYLIQWSV